MSTQTRTGGGGGGRNKAAKATDNKSAGDAAGINNKKNNVETAVVKTDKEKTQVKAKQPTAEQIRIAQITDIKQNDDPKILDKVNRLMEMTQRSEEEVCCALNECENDMEKAVIFLLETLPVGAFATTSKKKKNRLTSTGNDANAAGDGDWNNENSNANSGSAPNHSVDLKDRNRTTTRGGSRGGSGGGGGFSGRGRPRESRDGFDRDKDRNDMGKRDDYRSRGGRGGGSSIGGRGGYSSSGRGGRGGRMGSRNQSMRDQNRPMRMTDHQEIDSWEPITTTTSNDLNKSEDTWGDWDNEEYTGSLSDTKVFTPSSQTQSSVPNQTELSAPPGLEQQILNPPQPQADDLVQKYSTTVVSSTATAAAVNNVYCTTDNLRQAMEMPQINAASSLLSAEQSQYFNTLSSQNSNLQANVVNSSIQFNSSSVQYPPSYATGNTYVDQVSQQAPARRQRARVPPPSKIPASAVEMPGDTLNNIGYLDVQFGGLDFGTDDTFESVADKFSNASLESAANVQVPVVQQQQQQPEVVTSDYQTKAAVKSNMTGSLQTSQITTDTLSSAQQIDSLASTYSQRTPSSVSSGGGVSSINSTSTALDQLAKSDPYSQSAGTGSGGYSSVPYSSGSKGQSYQQSASQGGYNNSSYSSAQQMSSNPYPPSSNTYSSYNQNGVNSYQQQGNVSSNVSNQTSSSVGVSTVNNTNQSSLPAMVNSQSVSNASSNTNAGYMSNQYQVNQSSSAFPQQTGYQNSNQNVYGNTGYSGSTNTTSGQYSNFSSSKLKDTSVSTPFESVVSSSVASVTSSVSSVTSTVSQPSSMNQNTMSSPSLGLSSTKVLSNAAASNKNQSGVGQNVSSGVTNVAPMVTSQFIQAGMPFYQQPMYSYEDLQMMQQRMTHMPGYNDIYYQTPTSIGAVAGREANLSSVPYSTMSDGRFTRTDNNSSPVSNVPSTMSQQTGSGNPMMNFPYAYIYGGNMLPSGYQYGTPAIYPQQMATNATSGGQFPKPSYNSGGYGSAAYDTLSQTTQDYNKNPYNPSSVGQQSKGQTGSNPQTGGNSDITQSMYGKSHVALNKVNSYDKQSFHSGTPQIFNPGTPPGTQTASATSQAYGAQHLYIPAAMPTHHNINMHQPMHQDSNSRPQANNQGKTATKQGYSPSYWTAQN